MIDILKIENKDELKIKFDRTEGSSTDTHTVAYEDAPHPDFNKAIRKVKDHICEAYDFVEKEKTIPMSGEVVLERAYHLTKIEFGSDDKYGHIKFEMELALMGVDDPFKIKSKWLNDISIGTCIDLLDEAELFITGKKRAQSDMFAENLNVN